MTNTTTKGENKPTTQTDWRSRFEDQFFGEFWKMGIPLEPTTPEKEQERFKKSLKAFIANERKLVLEQVKALVEQDKELQEYLRNPNCLAARLRLNDLFEDLEKLERKDD